MDRRQSIRKTSGFTLLEMVMSLSVLAIAFAAVGSVFVLASHVMPTPDNAEGATLNQSAALSRLIEDLQVARYITEDSATAVTMVVDDRTGDGLPDRLRYAWSGNIGDPLTLSINGSAPADVVENLSAFNLAYTTEERVDSIPSTTRTSEEVLLHQCTTASSASERILNTSAQGIGQIIQPTLPDEATAYTVTRIRIRAKKKNPDNGVTDVRLYAVASGLPTGTTIAEQTMNESDLAASFEWVDIAFENTPQRPAGESTAIALEWNSGSNSAAIEFDSSRPQGLITRDSNGDPWVNDGDKSLLIEAYGTTITTTPGVALTRQVRAAAQVTLQVGSATAQTITTRLYCEPGVHFAVWDANFNASPVAIDLDGNGTDWKAQSGGSAGSFVNGQWLVDGTIYSTPDNTFNRPLIVDLVMGATASNRSGASFQINANQVGGLAIPITIHAGRNADGNHYVSVYDEIPLTLARLKVSDLGENPPRIRLIIAPAHNTAGLIVNGIPVGAFSYTPVNASGLSKIVTLSEIADGVFSEISIRIGATAVVTTGDGS